MSLVDEVCAHLEHGYPHSHLKTPLLVTDTLPSKR